MDTKFAGFVLIFGLLCLVVAENKYGDHGVVFTARAYTDTEDYRQLITIPTTPREVTDYPGRTFPGIQFDDIKMKLHACDVDYDMNLLYLYDYNYRSLIVGTNFNTSLNKAEINFTTEHYGISKEYAKIAVDWVSHNVYWTDPIMGAIVMQPGQPGVPQTMYKVIVNKHLDLPRGIAVDPIAGYLFWGDFSSDKTSKIERASLIGERRKPLVTSGLVYPDGLTADHSGQRLYFTNYQTVEYVNYDGTGRQKIFSKSNAYFFDIAFHGGVVVVTDIESPRYAYFYDVNTKEQIAKEDGSDEAYFGVCMYHKDNQPSKAEYRCPNAGCQDICVDEPGKDTATCVCRTGYELNNDGKTCKVAGGQYQRAVILNNGTHLCLLDIRILSDHHNYKIDCFYQHTDTSETMTYIEVNGRTREVYFATQKAIYRVPIDQQNANAVKLTATLPNNKGNGDVTGMSYDYTSGHLYWSEANPDAIFVMNPDSPATEFVQLATENHNLSNPRAILVLPHERQLLWLNGNDTSGDVIIMKTDLGASAPVEAVTLSEVPTDITIFEPTHMLNHVKDNRLYILDAGWSEILVFTYDGEYLTDFNIDDAKDFAIYNDYILVAHHNANNDTAMFSADLGFGPPFSKVVEEEEGVVEGIGLVVSMKILDVDVLQPPYPNPCRDLNGKSGGCEQTCIAISNETMCLCDVGFKLNADGKTCGSAFPTITDRFAVVVDTTHSSIHQISLDQAGVLNGINTASQTSITSVLYNYLTHKIILGSQDSEQVWQVNIDGTNETMLSDISWGSPVGLALDPSTGNIFFTAESQWSWWLDNWSFLGVISPTGSYLDLLEGDTAAGGITINIPGDIVLHAGKGYIFWTDETTSENPGKIVRASMDGSNAVIIAQGTGIEIPSSLAIDYEENMLYWGDEYLKTISKSDFDGNKRETFLDVGSVIGDIRMVGNYLYYTTVDNTKITKVHKSNTSDVATFGPNTGVGVLNALDIYISSEVSKIPKHAICSTDNGGCSDFCLPNEAGGRSCACEAYVDLLVDEQTCANRGCPSYTGNAYIASDCLRLPGYQCGYECFGDLKPKEQINKLTCLANKTWDIEMPCRDRYHQNKYNDYGVVLTARGFSLEDFNQVVVIPSKPADIPTYPARSFPGFKFPDVKKKLHAVDVDYHTNTIYMYDYEYRSIIVGDNFSADANFDAMNFTTEHYGVSQEYVKIAVDWISHNLYWTDTLMGAIIMAPGIQGISPTLYKVIVQDHLDLPRGIAVDPLAGYIFWTDLSRNSKIERASLLGANRRDIISSGLYIPDAIAADHSTQRIFFTNYNYIESATYDGLDRTNLVKNSQAYFFDISVFNNVIMATETSNYYLFLYDATTGREISQEGSAQEGYFGICTYDEDAQPGTPQELCATAGCQDICVEEPNAVKATCVCKTGSELQEDGKACKEVAGQYQRAILLNNGTHLCLLDIRILSDHHDHKVQCFYQHTEANETITYMDVNMKSREVYFTAGKSIYRVRIDTGSNAITASQLLSTPDRKNRQFTGLSYDWINDHLYWSQTGPDGIFLFNPDNPEDFLQIASENSTYNPRGVLVVPHNGSVFWIATNSSSGNSTFIEYGDLGLTRPLQQIVPTSDGDLKNPTHLVHDNKNDRVYVLDKGWKSILEASYNGTLTNYFEVGDAEDFALYNDYLLVMEHDKNGNTRLYSGDIGYFPYSLTADGLVEDIGTVVSLKVVDVDVLQKTYPSPCGEKEGKYGGCEQICIPVDNLPSCRCDTGFTLNSDNTSCDSAPVTDNFIVIVDNLHSKIYQIPLDNDTQLHGIKVPNKDNPTGIIYNYLTNQLVFGSWESSQIWGVNIDGTNATFIADIDEWYGTPTNFALDPSTGNLYITAYSYYTDYGFQDSFIAAVSPTGGVAILYNMGEYLADIVLHAKKGYMFWTDYGDQAMVARAGMDGSDIHMIADGGDVIHPTGLAIDYEAEHLYWQDALLHKIYKSDLDGQNKVLFHEDTSYMNDIRLFGDYLYYTSLENLHLTRIHKEDGANAKRIGPTAGIGAFATVDVYKSSMVSTIPVNTLCSKDNGNCSHFCLPNGVGGRTCGCEGTYKLLSDGITCENVPRCQAIIMGGTVDKTCHRLVDQQCDFTCSHGYKKKEGVLKLLCQETTNQETGDSEQKWDDETACEEIFCPAIIPNGQLPEKCIPKVDVSCLDYKCSQGYEKNKAVTSLNCTIDGVWNTDITTLCKEKCPVLTFGQDMAKLNDSCNRDPQEDCGYTCKKNYKPATNMTTIRCVSPSRWNVNTATLCEEILCPDYIPNGLVHTNCSFKVDSACTFDCSDRYNRNDEVSKIRCKPSGVWDKVDQDTSLCIAITVTPEKQTESLAIGLGVGLSILVILIIIIFVCILLHRMGKLHVVGRKSGGSGCAFENPQFEESSFGAPAGVTRESNKDFSYATLEDDKLELTDESWRKTQDQSKRASENVYDNSAPATIAASAINPKF